MSLFHPSVNFFKTYKRVHPHKYFSSIHSRTEKGICLSNLQVGSLTVEAAIALPIFIIFMLALIWPLNILYTELRIREQALAFALKTSEQYYTFSSISDALSSDNKADDANKENNGYSFDSYTDYFASNGAFILYCSQALPDEALRDHLSTSHIKKGSKGLSYKYSSLNKNTDQLDIVIDYSFGLNIPVKLPTLHCAQRFLVRGFNGKTLKDIGYQPPVFVYVTSVMEGSAYHRDPHCTHLLRTTAVYHSTLNPAKELYYNNKYYPYCSTCKKCNFVDTEYYYITETGEHFHTSLDCPTLQRNVFAIDYNKGVSGRRPCSRCY